MPSAALQSRIAAFESIAASPSQPRQQALSPALDIQSPPDTARPSFHASPSPSPPNLGRRTSLIDIKDWLDDNEGPSFTSNGFHGSNGPGQKGQYATRPPQHNSETPLIHLESPPRTRAKASAAATGSKAPPLPPRKPSLNSITSTLSSTSLISNEGREPPQLPARRADSLTVESAHTYPPKTDQSPRPGHAPTSSISSFHSVSLSSDNESVGPSSVDPHISTFPMDHPPSQKPNMTGESDSISLGESYEDVSADMLTSPATEQRIKYDWENGQRRSLPPKLPQRPSFTPPIDFDAVTIGWNASPRRPPSTTSLSSLARTPSASSATSSSTALNTPAPYVRRKPPPPPSIRSSDRSSVQSFSSGTSGSRSSTNSVSTISGSPYNFQKTKRPTPVPLAAKTRYELVFNKNVIQKRRVEKQKAQDKPPLLSPNAAKKIRQNAGWRGLSVDLIPGTENAPSSQDTPEEVSVDPNVEPSERLEGTLVRKIWRRSKLGKEKLRDIWNECDPALTGSLDRDNFVKGMWRIDEELRRAQIQAARSASTTSLSSLRPKGLSRPPPPLPSPRLKPILR